MRIRASVGRAWGTPFFSRGRGIGDTTTLDPSVVLPDNPNVAVTNPAGSFGFPVSGPPSWLPAASTLGQQAFSDVFSVLKLYNPVPPGTVMQSGPGGSYIARAADGQATPGYFPSVGGAGFGLGTILVVGGIIAVIALSRGDR